MFTNHSVVGILFILLPGKIRRDKKRSRIEIPLSSSHKSIDIKIKSVSVCVSVCLSEAQNCPSIKSVTGPRFVAT